MNVKMGYLAILLFAVGAVGATAADKPAPPILTNGCELECPCAAHPGTAILTAPVNAACPDVDGPAVLTVYDKQPGVSEAGKAVVHMAKSVSPCSCVTQTPICDCIANGVYKGETKHRLSTYEIPCRAETFGVSRPASAFTKAGVASTEPSPPAAPAPPKWKASLISSPPVLPAVSPERDAKEAAKTKFKASIAVLSVASTSSLPPDIQTALTTLAADSATLAEASTRVAQLALATRDLAAAQKKIMADQAGLKILLDALVNPPPVPVEHKIEILEITGPGCVPCQMMAPIIAKLAGEGIPIRSVDTTTTEGAGYAVAVTPTWIIKCDGKEIPQAEGTRKTGVLLESQLRSWHAAILEWSKTIK